MTCERVEVERNFLIGNKASHSLTEKRTKAVVRIQKACIREAQAATLHTTFHAKPTVCLVEKSHSKSRTRRLDPSFRIRSKDGRRGSGPRKAFVWHDDSTLPFEL